MYDTVRVSLLISGHSAVVKWSTSKYLDMNSTDANLPVTSQFFIRHPTIDTGQPNPETTTRHRITSKRNKEIAINKLLL